MDDHIFRAAVARCQCVQEATSYLEIFNYSVSRAQPRRGSLSSLYSLTYCGQDPRYNDAAQHPLLADEFSNFLHRRVREAPRSEHSTEPELTGAD